MGDARALPWSAHCSTVDHAQCVAWVQVLSTVGIVQCDVTRKVNLRPGTVHVTLVHVLQ